MMPKKFDDQFPSSQMIDLFTEELATGITGLTNEQLAYGISCVRSECTWPPSIAEFIKFCKTKDEGHIFKEYKRLPIKKASLETSKPYRDELKKLLGIKGNP